MKHTEDLKPCPFCGGEATVIETELGSGWWAIVCRKCHARTSVERSTAEAAEKWNRRIEE